MATPAKKVLITGHKGYIGSVMAPMLLKAGYHVVGLDTGYFDRCTLIGDETGIPSIFRDIRDVQKDDLKGTHAVIHLAALSNDPIGNLDAGWTRAINYQASVRLAEMAKAAGVRRFLFSSSCIMYGMAEANVVDEDSPLNPRTEYARSKVAGEEAIGALASDDFSPTFLRNGTIYGLSPRMRFDTVFNDLLGAAVTTGEVVVYGDGKPWRPVVHVEDVARAFMAVLEAPAADVHNQSFNTGADYLNRRVLELAEIAAQTVPGCAITVRSQAGADQRTYKADFAKFARVFPRFEFHWTAEKGARQVCRGFQALGLEHEDLVDRRFTRLKWLRYLLENEFLDGALRWKVCAEERAYD